MLPIKIFLVKNLIDPTKIKQLAIKRRKTAYISTVDLSAVPVTLKRH